METIAAISTPLAAGGIGIVRISGEKAIETADTIFRSKSGKKISDMSPYTAAYGNVYDGKNKIDDCIVLLFKAPKSYTGEDVVEISCHGGVYVMKKVLASAINAGARLAEPGEFTKRAFLNGKLDLTEAESVMDVINAKNSAALKAASSQREGSLYKKLIVIKNQLVDIASDLAAWIDYPDEDVPSLDHEILSKKLIEIEKRIRKYIDEFEKGRIIREGANAVITGKPNVGKSTLMNALSGYEKSIVTDIPGTTRDVVEDIVHFGDLVLNLSDTAGLRQTEDVIEKIGVEKAWDRIDKADIIYAVLDGSRTIEQEDIKLLKTIKDKPSVVIINKADLGLKIDEETIKKYNDHVIAISAKDEKGIDELQKVTSEILGMNEIDINAGFLANERQRQCAMDALNAAVTAEETLKEGMTLDAVSVEVEEAANNILKLTGERASEEIVDSVFSKFCVGK